MSGASSFVRGEGDARFCKPAELDVDLLNVVLQELAEVELDFALERIARDVERVGEVHGEGGGVCRGEHVKCGRSSNRCLRQSESSR